MDLVIFDLDGVLVDSEWLMARIWSDCLATHAVGITPETLIRRFVGVTDASMADVIRAESGKTLPPDLLDEIRRDSRTRFQSELEAIDGADAVLRALTVAKCVCSNSGPERIRRSLSVTGLAGHFADDHLFSGTEMPRPKPAPDLHLHASGALGVVPARAVVIEDSVTGVQAAVAAGMTAIGFIGASHAGEGNSEGLLEAGAVSICAAMADLPEHLARLN